LEFQVARRISFRAALAAWFPDSDLFTKEAQSEDDDESDAAPTPTPVIPPPVETVAPPQQPQQPQPPVARRLVLKGWGGSAGRNKTRKNPDS